MNKPTDSGWTSAKGVGRYVERYTRTATWDCAASAVDIEAVIAEWRKDWRCGQGGARVNVDVTPSKTTVTISAEIDSGD
jgi:hypothetical protein